jgi:hypothetical protein
MQLKCGDFSRLIFPSCVDTVLGALIKLKKATISFIMSVRPFGTTRVPMNGFSWNFIFEDFSNISRVHSSFIKIWQEWRALYMTTLVHKDNISLNTSYNDKYFKQSCRENQHKPFIVNNVSQIVLFIGLLGKTWSIRTGNRWQHSMAHALWMLDNQGYRHTLKNVTIIAFPWQKSSSERASMLRLYAHCIHCLF